MENQPLPKCSRVWLWTANLKASDESVSGVFVFWNKKDAIFLRKLFEILVKNLGLLKAKLLLAWDHFLRQSITYRPYVTARETWGRCVLEEPTVPSAKFVLNVHSINKPEVQLECRSQCGKADDSLISYGSSGQKITPTDWGNLSDLGKKNIDVSYLIHWILSNKNDHVIWREVHLGKWSRAFLFIVCWKPNSHLTDHFGFLELLLQFPSQEMTHIGAGLFPKVFQ